MPSIELRFLIGQYLPIPQLRMRSSRAVPQIEIGFELLPNGFGL
jgi:hypothetical protein